MTIKELFNFIVDQTITYENRVEYLEKLQEIASTRPVGEMTDKERVDEEVFKNAFLPKTLDEVVDLERDRRQLKEGIKTEDDITYRTIIGLNKDLSGVELTPSILPNKNDDSSGDGSADGDNSDESEDEGSDDTSNNRLTIVRPRGESPSSRKERKKAFKDAKAEKRKTKVKKHLKKRAEKERRKK